MTTPRAIRRAVQFLMGGREEQGGIPAARNAFPAWRVFIYGFEVTEDVTAVSFRQHVGKQPNTCTISLLNQRSKYVLTTRDMLWWANLNPEEIIVRARDAGSGNISEVMFEALDAITDVEARDPDETYSASSYFLSNPTSVKRAVFDLKRSHQPIDVNAVNVDGTSDGTIPQSRYPFVDGEAIFHADDPVRVFVRDPFDMNVWFHGFAGKISDISDEITQNNQMTLSITVEDPTKVLRYARVLNNPAIMRTELLITPADIVTRNAFGSPIVDKSLVEIVDFLVFGGRSQMSDRSAAGEAPQNMNTEQLKLRAIQTGEVSGIDPTTANFRGMSPEQIFASLTADQREALDAYVERNVTQNVITSSLVDVFELDFINRFGDKVVRRYDRFGVGAFKPATEAPIPAPNPDAVGIDGSQPNNTTVNPYVDVPEPVDQLQLTAAEQALLSAAGNTGNPGIGDFGLRGIAQRMSTSERVERSNNSQQTELGPHVYSLGEDPEITIPYTPVSLEQWESIISSHVRKSDIADMLCKDSEPAGYAETLPARLGKSLESATVEDVITLIGEDPVNFPVDGGRVFMLLPIGAGAAGRDVISKSICQDLANRTDFQSRLSLMYAALDRVEFVMFVTGRGDIVIEFPLYDFDPRDFGAFERNYIVEVEDQQGSTQTSSEAPVRTICVIDHAPSNFSEVATDIQASKPPTVVALANLFPMYGARAESGNLKGLIQTENAARLYGHILLNRVNADAHSVSLPMVIRFGLNPNRPVLWKMRNHIGTIVDISHNLAWNSPWRTTLGLNHMRGWTGQLTARGDMLYNPIGGRESRPLNYQVLFARQADAVTPDVNRTETPASRGESTAPLRDSQ